jgi:hypothetical protein
LSASSLYLGNPGRLSGQITRKSFKEVAKPWVTWITASRERRPYPPRHGGSGVHRLKGDQHMRDDQELSIDQLSIVNGGAASIGNGSLPHPNPSPVEVIIKWILGKLT